MTSTSTRISSFRPGYFKATLAVAEAKVKDSLVRRSCVPPVLRTALLLTVTDRFLYLLRGGGERRERTRGRRRRRMRWRRRRRRDRIQIKVNNN